MAKPQGSDGWCIAQNSWQLLWSQHGESRGKRAAVAGECQCHGCKNPSTIFQRNVGYQINHAASSGCHNSSSCDSMPLVCSPHLCDKSSYFVHTHLKEGADHQNSQTQLSTAEHMWDGAGDGGCHGNPSFCFSSLSKLWYQAEIAWSSFYYWQWLRGFSHSVLTLKSFEYLLCLFTNSKKFH